MAVIPQQLKTNQANEALSKTSHQLLYQGKVRDTWRFVLQYLLVVASDRISIFDFVLNALIPQKGEYLTALTHFWLTDVLKDHPNHLIQLTANPNINGINKFRDSIPGLPIERCLLIQDLTDLLVPFELIFRLHIGGSVYNEYLKTGMAGGHTLTPDLPQWSKLDSPIFTPSTKEESGHDVNITAEECLEKMGENSQTLVRTLTTMFADAYRFAEQRGILILDTKFEASSRPLMIADEVLTPDSSRFVDADDWKRAMAEGRSPEFFDKQPVRDWGAAQDTPKGQGIKNLDPENPDDIAFVHGLKVPQLVISAAVERNKIILMRLTGLTLKQYQKDAMGI